MKNKLMFGIIGLLLISSVCLVLAEDGNGDSIADKLIGSMINALTNPSQDNLIAWAYASIDAKNEINRLENELEYEKNKVKSCGSGTTSSPTTNPIQTESNNWCNGADLNQDGIVDLTDLGIMRDDIAGFKSNWGDDGCSDLNDWCNGSDLDKDSKVNLSDLGIMRDKYDSFDGEFGATGCFE